MNCPDLFSRILILRKNATRIQPVNMLSATSYTIVVWTSFSCPETISPNMEHKKTLPKIAVEMMRFVSSPRVKKNVHKDVCTSAHVSRMFVATGGTTVKNCWEIANAIKRV